MQLSLPPRRVPPDVIQQSQPIVPPGSQESVNPLTSIPRAVSNSNDLEQRTAPREPAAPPAHIDNRDPYYGYGSPRQGRRSYIDGPTSREDLYRDYDPGYAYLYHSGRSTPSSDRNSPAYNYSSSSYPSHHYGYPSYPDTQSSMDMYHYLTMLYYYYQQHYERYCAQQGYTPEQMAQVYSGMQGTSDHDTSQPEQGMQHFCFCFS